MGCRSCGAGGMKPFSAMRMRDSGAVPPSGDPDFAFVSCLLPLTGPDGSLVINDAKGATWTAEGAAEIDTAQSVYSGSSLLVPSGNFTSRVSSPATAAYAFGAGAAGSNANDFTIEGWVRFAAHTRGYLYSNNENAAALIVTSNTGAIEVYGPGSWVINAGGTPFALNTWYFISLDRVEDEWTVRRDGVTYVSNPSDTRSWGVAAGNIAFGNISQTGGIAIDGHMQDWRITAFKARHFTDFTPPPAPFPTF